MICVHCEEIVDDAGRCPHCGSSPLVDERYRLVEVLGRGANANTYRAVRIADGRTVALKEMLVANARSFDVLEDFEREARLLETLDHPNIPSYFEDFTAELGPGVGLYVAQEYVGGDSLADELERGPLPAPAAFRVVRSVAGTLDYLRNLSPPVVHRDIKPANLIRRRNGEVALIDFGSVADVLGTSESDIPTMAGTAGYMAPEQLGGRTDVATDIYGLGATALALLTAGPPQSASFEDDWCRELPPTARAVLKKMLASAPGNRPTPRDVLDALAAFEEEFDARDAVAAVAGRQLDALDPVPRPAPPSLVHRDPDLRQLVRPVIGMGIFAIGFAAFGFYVGSWIPVVIGVCLVALPIVVSFGQGEFGLNRRRWLYRNGEAVLGRVEDRIEHPGLWSELAYSFRYEGTRREGSAVTNDAAAALEPGQPLVILVDPRDPTIHEPLVTLAPEEYRRLT